MAPKKNKKQPKNAFYYFLLDYEQKMGQAIRNLDNYQIAERASNEWKRMSWDERKRFEDMATKERNSGEKYTSLGVPISEQDRREREKRARVHTMELEVEELVRRLGMDPYNALVEHPFYFLHCNCFVRTEKGYVVPAELALSEFTIKRGIQRTVSTFLNIRDIPQGYSCTAKDIKEKTHKIPLPPDLPPPVCSDPVEIMEKLHRFTRGFDLDDYGAEFDDPDDPPLMFTTCREIEIVRECIGAIVAESHVEEPVLLKVYPLETLFHHLLRFCNSLEGKEKQMPTMSVAEIELEKDRYNYAPNVACEFHEEADERPHCSRAKVHRWGYVISDFVCAPLGVEMVDNRHCPPNARRSHAQRVQNKFTNMAAAPRPLFPKKELLLPPKKEQEYRVTPGGRGLTRVDATLRPGEPAQGHRPSSLPREDYQDNKGGFEKKLPQFNQGPRRPFSVPHEDYQEDEKEELPQFNQGPRRPLSLPHKDYQEDEKELPQIREEPQEKWNAVKLQPCSAPVKQWADTEPGTSSRQGLYSDIFLPRSSSSAEVHPSAEGEEEAFRRRTEEIEEELREAQLRASQGASFQSKPRADFKFLGFRDGKMEHKNLGAFQRYSPLQSVPFNAPKTRPSSVVTTLSDDSEDEETAKIRAPRTTSLAMHAALSAGRGMGPMMSRSVAPSPMPGSRPCTPAERFGGGTSYQGRGWMTIRDAATPGGLQEEEARGTSQGGVSVPEGAELPTLVEPGESWAVPVIIVEPGGKMCVKHVPKPGGIRVKHVLELKEPILPVYDLELKEPMLPVHALEVLPPAPVHALEVIAPVPVHDLELVPPVLVHDLESVPPAPVLKHDLEPVPLAPVCDLELVAPVLVDDLKVVAPVLVDDLKVIAPVSVSIENESENADKPEINWEIEQEDVIEPIKKKPQLSPVKEQEVEIQNDNDSVKSEKREKEKLYDSESSEEDYHYERRRRVGKRKHYRRSRSRSDSSDYERGRRRGRNSDRDRERERSWERRERRNSYGRNRSSYDRERRSYDRERSYDRDRSYGRERSYDRDRSYGRERSYDRDQEGRRKKRHSYRDSSNERGSSNERERGKERRRKNKKKKRSSEKGRGEERKSNEKAESGPSNSQDTPDIITNIKTEPVCDTVEYFPYKVVKIEVQNDY